jgi:hypothetical protein
MAKKAAGKTKKTAGERKKRAAAIKAKTAASETTNPPIWTPSKFALWSQRWDDPNDASPTSFLLHHPTAPYPDNPLLVDQVEDSTKDIQQLAFDYLTDVNERTDIESPLQLPPAWLKQLNSKQVPLDEKTTFRWLPIGWPSDDVNFADPFVSFRVVRKTGDKLADEALVLMASEWRRGAYLGSEFGIRVVASVRQSSAHEREVRIIGMSASLPFGRYFTDGVSIRDWESDLAFDRIIAGRAAVTANMAEQLRLEKDSVKVRGVRIAKVVGDDVQVEWRCTGKAKTTDGGANATPYSFVFVGTPEQAGVLISKVELVADATPGFARVFPLDPESKNGPRDARKRHPIGSERELDKAREREKVTKTGNSQLIYPEPLPHLPEQMRVEVCRGFVLDDRAFTSGAPKVVDLPDTGPDAPFIRSNDFAAISAYQNVKRFFQRLEEYGLGAHRYFQIAKLPLKLFYRSGIRPGPGKDGQAVNARVLVEGWKVDFEGPTTPGQHPRVEMHLAMANLAIRARKPWNGKRRSPAEPIGIAADPRWIWHEIGHVLLMASVGELQFRFAHSPGDALAAIVADPQSKLAPNANWRGATFPWVFIPRRHDRCVSHGWSWGGSMHYASSRLPESQAPRRKGYWTEQILSSSLFRLYRCIGGDTTRVGLPDQPDKDVRESASHYSVFLIMKGIQLLGPGAVVPAIKPEQFITALRDADTSTDVWDVTFPPDSTPQLKFHRIGGCVHKVIRWAFEAQGMYTPPGKITNAPGTPPPVDVYIQDLRPTSDTSAPSGAIQYGPGGYNPVSLDWDPDQKQSDKPPQWQASRDAIVVSSTGEISVVVKNRGTQQAKNVEVSVWWHDWPTGAPSGPPPDWDTSWTRCSPSGSTVLDIAPSGEKTFGPFSAVPSSLAGKRYLLLAIASCADDLANTATSFACSFPPTPLLDLAANDNNLGLWVFGP